MCALAWGAMQAWSSPAARMPPHASACWTCVAAGINTVIFYSSQVRHVDQQGGACPLPSAPALCTRTPIDRSSCCCGMHTRCRANAALKHVPWLRSTVLVLSAGV